MKVSQREIEALIEDIRNYTVEGHHPDDRVVDIDIIEGCILEWWENEQSEDVL